MRLSPVAIVLAMTACGNIGSPEIISSDVYEFGDTALGQSVVFHWPRSALPVRIWVASDSPIKPDVATAIDRWQGAFLYGEFRATIVTDSNTADVIVRNAPSDLGGGLSARARECDGETELNLDPVAKTATLPFHVFVYAVVAETNPGLPACYDVTMTHELGHVLGMINFAHSGTTAGDVMFGNPTAAGISERDRLTAVTLYHVPSTITISGRR